MDNVRNALAEIGQEEQSLDEATLRELVVELRELAIWEKDGYTSRTAESTT